MRDQDAVWRGEVANELRHIIESVREVQRQIYDLHTQVVAELSAHRDYHARNEHLWGGVKWCQLHPFRLAAVLAVGASALLWRSQPSAWPQVLRLAREALK